MQSIKEQVFNHGFQTLHNPVCDWSRPRSVWSFIVDTSSRSSNQSQVNAQFVSKLNRSRMDDREIISDLVVTAASIATFVIDLVIGSLVLWKQYQNSDFIVLFFVAFIIFTPGFITSVLSIIRMCREPSALPRLPPFFRFLRYFCILCLISPISG